MRDGCRARNARVPQPLVAERVVGHASLVGGDLQRKLAVTNFRLKIVPLERCNYDTAEFDFRRDFLSEGIFLRFLAHTLKCTWTISCVGIHSDRGTIVAHRKQGAQGTYLLCSVRSARLVVLSRILNVVRCWIRFPQWHSSVRFILSNSIFCFNSHRLPSCGRTSANNQLVRAWPRVLPLFLRVVDVSLVEQ